MRPFGTPARTPGVAPYAGRTLRRRSGPELAREKKQEKMFFSTPYI
ncbi:MAG: hypothetical protein AVDCRST_MAG56-1875 [uncultured Cytophagales bacterium]|uniref:Uncharacterized protein n=1 Tax=uncultured Cytophagales bacterium TaxID=158755 RepID=A0A6J4IHA5_9SPHI|nr:MAG: hypothetical protein AVDCRST_MAG56-1875 [uncultured Cytophagales bacterium]